MKEKLYTIPLMDAFKAEDECPFCFVAVSYTHLDVYKRQIEKSRILSCPSLFPYRNLYLTCLRSVFTAIIEAFCFNNELHVATHGSIFSCEGCISSRCV